MDELKRSFPPDLDYAIVYDTTPFIDESINEVFKALRDAIILVAIVVLAFLQSWRATLIPLIAVPVAIVGTFAVMLGMGFSLNNLSLFGLVLAIGIVVDDAIVVVEAVEHHLEHGLSPKEAARKAMDEVTGPIIAISLVLMCVFIPCAFITGITGQFFRQFALTIAVSTFFSAVNSLTLSPALCGLLLKPKHEQRDPLTLADQPAPGLVLQALQPGLQVTADGYSQSVRMLLRVSVIVLVIYGGLLYLTYFGFTQGADRLHPVAGQGLLARRCAAARLGFAGAHASRDGADRKDRPRREAGQRQPRRRRARRRIARRRARQRRRRHPRHRPHDRDLRPVDRAKRHRLELRHRVCRARRVSSSARQRAGGGRRSPRKLRAACYREVQEAQVAVFGAPAVDGLGSAGGFKVMVRDTGALGLDSLQEAADGLAASGNEQPGLVGLFSAFRAQTPQMYVDIDRERCKAMGVPLNEVFLTLQLYLGGYYTNDFNQFGRTWQVNLQGDPRFRLSPEQVRQLKVRNLEGRDGAAGQRRRRQPKRAARRWSSATTASPRPRSTAARCPASAPAPSFARSKTSAAARAAAGHEPAMDRADAAADSGRQHGDHRVRRGRRARLPRAGGAVRKPDAAAGGHPRRADVPALLGDRRVRWPAWTSTSSCRSASSCSSAWPARTRS